MLSRPPFRPIYGSENTTEALNLVQERATTEGDFMNSPSQTFDYFRLFYAGKQEREHFALMLLESQHKVLECSVLFSGTIDGAAQ